MKHKWLAIVVILFLACMICIISYVRNYIYTVEDGIEMREVSSAIYEYVENSGGHLPNLRNRSVLISEIGALGSDIDVSHWNPTLATPYSNVPYVCNAAISGKELNKLPSGVLILYDAQSTGGKRNVIITHGRAGIIEKIIISKLVDDHEFDALERVSGIK